jgi:hypothetical protein
MTSAPAPRPAATAEAAAAEAAQAARLRALLARLDDPADPRGAEELAVAVLQWARARTRAAAGNPS